MKKAYVEASQSIQERLHELLDGFPLPDGTEEQALAIVSEGFEALEKDERTRRAVTVTQAGEAYRVENATNFLDLRMGKTITRGEVENLMKQGISVRIQKNK